MRTLQFLALCLAGLMLAGCQATAQTPLIRLGPYQTKAMQPTGHLEYVKLRPWRNVPAPFVTPPNVSTNPLKMGWQRWSASRETGDFWIKVTRGSVPYDGRYGVPNPENTNALIWPVEVRAGTLTNFVLHEMAMTWNPADTYNEYLTDLWEYRTRMNLGLISTGRELDRISYPWATLAIGTGQHRIDFTTNFAQWRPVLTSTGPATLRFDIDERVPQAVWKAIKL